MSDGRILVRGWREKYPGAYDEIPDAELLPLIQKKWPGAYDEYTLEGERGPDLTGAMKQFRERRITPEKPAPAPDLTSALQRFREFRRPTEAPGGPETLAELPKEEQYSRLRQIYEIKRMPASRGADLPPIPRQMSETFKTPVEVQAAEAKAAETAATPLIPLSKLARPISKYLIEPAVQSGALGPVAQAIPKEYPEALLRGALKVPEGFTSPAAIGTLVGAGAAAALAPVLRPLISAGFSVEMIEGAIQGVPEIKKAYEEGRYEDVLELVPQVLGSAALGGLAGVHAVKGFRAPGLERARQQAEARGRVAEAPEAQAAGFAEMAGLREPTPQSFGGAVEPTYRGMPERITDTIRRLQAQAEARGTVEPEYGGPPTLDFSELTRPTLPPTSMTGVVEGAGLPSETTPRPLGGAVAPTYRGMPERISKQLREPSPEPEYGGPGEIDWRELGIQSTPEQMQAAQISLRKGGYDTLEMLQAAAQEALAREHERQTSIQGPGQEMPGYRTAPTSGRDLSDLIKAAQQREAEPRRPGYELLPEMLSEEAARRANIGVEMPEYGRVPRVSPLESPTGAPLPPPSSPKAPTGEVTATPSEATVDLSALYRKPSTGGHIRPAITVRGTKVDTVFRVVEGEDLITSHDPGLKLNPRYPSGLQPRDRMRVASEDQVSRIANQLEPGQLGESALASEGAPIVGPDLVVESGNARVLGILRAYERVPERAAGYWQYWMENAPRLGLDPAEVAGKQKPIVVRERVSEVDRARFAQEANESAIASMSATEQALADAQRMSPELIARFRPGETGEIMTAGNQEFVRGFMEDLISPAERGRYMTGEGTLAQEGLTRIRNAIFAKAYGDTPTARAALERMSESTDSNVRNIEAVLLRKAPLLISFKDAVARGVRYPLDISEDLAVVVGKISALRQQGVAVADYLKQGELYGAELNPLQRTLLETFDRYKHAPNKLSDIIDQYIRNVETVGDPNQKAMFAGGRPGKLDLFHAARETMTGGFSSFSKGEAVPTNGAQLEQAIEGMKQRAGRAPKGRGKRAGEAGFIDIGDMARSVREFVSGLRALPRSVEIDPQTGDLKKTVGLKAAADRVLPEFIKRGIYVDYVKGKSPGYGESLERFRAARDQAEYDAVMLAHSVEKLKLNPVQETQLNWLLMKARAYEMTPELLRQADPRAVQAAETIWRHTAVLGRRMVDTGLMTEETLRKSEGRFTARYYGFGADDPVPAAIYFSDTKIPTRSEQGRVKFKKDIPEHVRQAWDEWMEWRRVAKRTVYEEERLIAKHEFLGETARNPDIVLQELPPDLRQAADRMNAMVAQGKPIPKGMRLPKHHAVGEKRYELAPLEDRYGALAGKYVEENHLADIRGVLRMAERNVGFETVKLLTNWWKVGKTAFNYAGLARDFVGSHMIADSMAHVSPSGFARGWAETIKGLDSPHYQRAIKDGAIKGTFVRGELAEIYRGVYERGDNFTDRFLNFLSGLEKYRAVAAAKKVGQWHLDLKQSIDELLRMQIYMDRIDKGFEPTRAAADARKYGLDYDKVPPMVKWARSYAIPFLTFNWKVLPRWVEAATGVAYENDAVILKEWARWNKHPIDTASSYFRFWKYPLMLSILNDYFSREIGETEEEQTLRESVSPTYMQTPTVKELTMGPRAFTMPMRDMAGHPVTLDLTFTLPWNGLLEESMLMPGFPSMLTPSHPLITEGITAITGRSPETAFERKVAPEQADFGEKVAAYGEHAARTFLPSNPLVPGSYPWRKLASIGEPDYKGDVRGAGTTLLDVFAGIKLRPTDVQGRMNFLRAEANREIRALETEAARNARAAHGDAEKIMAIRARTEAKKAERLAELRQRLRLE